MDRRIFITTIYPGPLRERHNYETERRIWFLSETKRGA
jgi:hypothetical protein